MAVAFFDIDGTLFRSSLLIELVEELIDEGLFPAAAELDYQEAKERWQNREGTYEAYIEAVVKCFLVHIKGVHYGDFADLGRALVDQQGKKVYRYTRDLIQSLKADGWYLVAVSQSPKSILDDFCHHYGFDKVYGRIYEIGPQDRFTGRVIDEYLIQNKANIAKRVFDNNQLLRKESAMAVGDTEGDIPLLELVGQPICFNPNERLLEHARLMKWPVVVERKDVIYRF